LRVKRVAQNLFRKENKMNKRTAAKLNRLADFIEANPKEYNQSNSANCIVGLGNRLDKGKLGAFVFNWNDVSEFSSKFNIKCDIARHIFPGEFGKVVKGFRFSPRAKPATAVRFLRAFAAGENLVS
jgi:hypothetical protein